jgi:hypothetical protein
MREERKMNKPAEKKKLSLKRETLRELTKPELQQAVGGIASGLCGATLYCGYTYYSCGSRC